MAADTSHTSQANQQHTGRNLGQRYVLTEPLAEGSLCAVYRGEDRVLRRPIAVKVISAERAPVYWEALRRTAMLAHPATIVVYDVIEQDGWLFLVQEYVPARPLSAYVAAGVPVERAVALAGQLARALAYAHAQDIMHGDLTPAAVLVDRQATVRLNNFAFPRDAAYMAETRERLARAARLEADAAADAPSPAPTDGAGTDEADTEAEDTWAAGALLWLLVTSPVGSGAGETREFRDDVPEMVRAVVRRCVFPGQAEPITAMEPLALVLEALAEQLRQARPMSAPLTPPALRAARDAISDMAKWPEDELERPVLARAGRPWARAAVAGGSLFEAPTDPQLMELGAGTDLAATQPAAAYGDTPTAVSPVVPRFSLPSRPLPSRPPTAGPLGEPSVPRWEARVDGEGALTAEEGRVGIGLATVLIVGLLLFIVFFVVGFMAPSLFAH